ncbi:ABC transporter permease [Acaryochloris sp. IP29b_bin.137]|uniref:ABC transporter permease n=1 Tax=Acaryochloris sp. IP29b_bin.137 TaxID=2969217 RepID=UPI0026262C0F|nr:ABC transporter permease [Acaryochloris sp. IP29b_bin.137]
MSRSSALRSYVVARLLLAPLMIWTVTTAVFLLMRATPGDPIDAILGPKAPAAQKLAIRSQLGLDLPLWQQYTNYLKDLLNFDLGTSLSSRGEPVWNIIQQHFPATLELALCSLTVALILGVTVGILSASRPDTSYDFWGRMFGIGTYALPMFWVGMLFKLFFAVQLGWFPDSTRFSTRLGAPQGPTSLYTIDSLLIGDFHSFGVAIYHLALPSLTLGLFLSGIFERIVRVNLKQSLTADYVEAARARGIPEWRILVFHALRNALIPVITVLGLTISAMLGGSVLTEVTFSWPGLGNRLYDAISLRDYPTVQGIIVFVSVITVMSSIVIDIVNAYVDPRIRY